MGNVPRPPFPPLLQHLASDEAVPRSPSFATTPHAPKMLYYYHEGWRAGTTDTRSWDETAGTMAAGMSPPASVHPFSQSPIDPTTTAGPSSACVLSTLAAPLSQAAQAQARLARRPAFGQALSRRGQAPLPGNTHNVIGMTSRNRHDLS
ncbi:hypothetical protein LA080_010214 [Diaporthe eres]|nr:hypothetical protein LA080_010214 [Diaporthe eres]